MPGQIFQFNVDHLARAGKRARAWSRPTRASSPTPSSSRAASNAGKKFMMFGGDADPQVELPDHRHRRPDAHQPLEPGQPAVRAATRSAATSALQDAGRRPRRSTRSTRRTSTARTAPRRVPERLQVTISIAGTSTTQKSYMGVFISNYGTDTATKTVYGAGTFMDSYRMGANQRIGRGISNQATADTGCGQRDLRRDRPIPGLRAVVHEADHDQRAAAGTTVIMAITAIRPRRAPPARRSTRPQPTRPRPPTIR